MRPARSYTYLSYENDVEGDCEGSSYAHCVHAITGTPPTDADQQKMVRATNDLNGTQTSFLLWRMMFRSLDHFRQHSFGTIGSPIFGDWQSQIQWAIDRYGAVMLCVDGGGHEVAGIDYDAGGAYVVAHEVAGKVEYMTWAQIKAEIAQRGSFAFSQSFDLLLIANGVAHNWVWWVGLPIVALLSLYVGGVV